MWPASKWIVLAMAGLVGQTVAGMPRQQIVDEVLGNPQFVSAAPADGRPVFDKVCSGCHRFGSMGKDVGPDLTTLAARLKKAEILEAILWPSRTIPDQYQSTLIEKRDGTIVAGMVQREDAVRVVLVTPQALDRPVTVLKSQVKVRQKSPTSLMPEDLLSEFTLSQVASLVAFLVGPPPR